MGHHRRLLAASVMVMACVLGCLMLGGWSVAKAASISDLLSSHLGGQSTSSGSAQSSTASDAYVDADGNVTVSTLLSLGGKDLAGVLADQGYTYDTDKTSETYGYFVKGEAWFTIAEDVSADLGMSDQDIAALGTSTVDPAMIVMDFPSTMVAKDWIEGQGVKVNESTFADTGCLATIESGSVTYLLMVYPSTTFDGMMEAAVLDDDASQAIFEGDVDSAYTQLVETLNGSAEGTGSEVDAEGNVTVAAILGLSGADLSNLFEQQGYTYDDDSASDSYGFFVKGTDSAIALITDISANTGMSADDLAASGTSLPGIVCAIMTVPSAQMPEAWLATQGVTVAKSTVQDGACLALIQVGDVEYLLMAESSAAADEGTDSSAVVVSSASSTSSASSASDSDGSAMVDAGTTDMGAMDVYIFDDTACEAVYGTGAEDTYASLAGLASDASDSGVDAEGNVTLGAVFGMSGQELSDLLSAQGYTYDSTYDGFVKSDTSALGLVLNVSDDNALDDSALVALGDKPVAPCFVTMLIPTDSDFDAWLAEQGVTIDEKVDLGSDGYLAIIEAGEDQEEYLVEVTASTTVSGAADVYVFDDETCQALYGMSIDDAFASVTSGDSVSATSEAA